MNIKNVFSMVNDVLTGIGGVLMSLVSVSILSTVIFGAGWLGIDVITNISALVGNLNIYDIYYW